MTSGGQASRWPEDALLIAIEARIRATAKRLTVIRSRPETNRPELVLKYRREYVRARLERVHRLAALERMAERDRQDAQRRAQELLEDPVVEIWPDGRIRRRLANGATISA